MKIKISKSQWEEMGRKSGWFKTAKIGVNDISEILDHIKAIWQIMERLQGVYKFAPEKQKLIEFQVRMEKMLQYAEAESNVPMKKQAQEENKEEMLEAYLKFKDNGRANEKGITEKDVSPEELAMGTEVEYEHTTDKETAKRIALDHLAELKDYYTRLKKMEEEGKKDGSEVKE